MSRSSPLLSHVPSTATDRPTNRPTDGASSAISLDPYPRPPPARRRPIADRSSVVASRSFAVPFAAIPSFSAADDDDDRYFALQTAG